MMEQRDSCEREEGELTDDETLMREQIKAFEIKNYELEQIENISCSTKEFNAAPKFDVLHKQQCFDSIPSDMSSISSAELISPPKRCKERKKRVHANSNQKRHRSNGRSKRRHVQSKKLRIGKEQLKISFQNIENSDDDEDSDNYCPTRENLRLALAHTSKNNSNSTMRASLKERLSSNIREGLSKNEPKAAQKTKTKCESLVTVAEEIPKDDDSLEEAELRMIALKSAVIRKHIARKRRKDGNKAYSPTEFDAMNATDTEDVFIHTIDELEISPLSSPLSITDIDGDGYNFPLRDTVNQHSNANNTNNHEIIDMEIVHSDSDVEMTDCGTLTKPDLCFNTQKDGMNAGSPTLASNLAGINNNKNNESNNLLSLEENVDTTKENSDCDSDEENALRALLLAKLEATTTNVAKRNHRNSSKNQNPSAKNITLQTESILKNAVLRLNHMSTVKTPLSNDNSPILIDRKVCQAINECDSSKDPSVLNIQEQEQKCANDVDKCINNLPQIHTTPNDRHANSSKETDVEMKNRNDAPPEIINTQKYVEINEPTTLLMPTIKIVSEMHGEEDALSEEIPRNENASIYHDAEDLNDEVSIPVVKVKTPPPPLIVLNTKTTKFATPANIPRKKVVKRTKIKSTPEIPAIVIKPVSMSTKDAKGNALSANKPEGLANVLGKSTIKVKTQPSLVVSNLKTAFPSASAIALRKKVVKRTKLKYAPLVPIAQPAQPIETTNVQHSSPDHTVISSRLITSPNMLPQIPIKRLVINLKPSDSEEDDSEMRTMKSLNSNAHVQLSSSSDHRLKHNTGTKDTAKILEKKIDAFLKNIRTISTKSNVLEQTTLTNSAQFITPVAVKHLPKASQEEYLSLVHRMNLLQQKKQNKQNNNANTDNSPLPHLSNKNSDLNTIELDSNQLHQQHSNATLFANLSKRIITHLDKSLRCVEEATVAKRAKIESELRLNRLRAQLEKEQQNFDIQQKTLLALTPIILKENTTITALKQKRTKLLKSQNVLSDNSTQAKDFIIRQSLNDYKHEIIAKSKQLAANIQNINSIKYKNIEEMESRLSPTIIARDQQPMPLQIHGYTGTTPPRLVNTEDDSKNIGREKPVTNCQLKDIPVADDGLIDRLTENANVTTGTTNSILNLFQGSVNKTPCRPEDMEKPDTEIITPDLLNEPLPSCMRNDDIFHEYISPISYRMENNHIGTLNSDGILCPFELMGECKDTDCTYTHFEHYRTKKNGLLSTIVN